MYVCVWERETETEMRMETALKEQKYVKENKKIKSILFYFFQSDKTDDTVMLICNPGI